MVILKTINDQLLRLQTLDFQKRCWTQLWITMKSFMDVVQDISVPHPFEISFKYIWRTLYVFKNVLMKTYPIHLDPEHQRSSFGLFWILFVALLSHDIFKVFSWHVFNQIFHFLQVSLKTGLWVSTSQLTMPVFSSSHDHYFVYYGLPFLPFLSQHLSFFHIFERKQLNCQNVSKPDKFLY